MTLHSHIISTGSYLPRKQLTNDDLASMVETNDAWIRSRTGIESRHIAEPDELTSDMAYAAATACLHHAGITAQQVDSIIVATTTPDRTFPSTAVKVQHRLGNRCAFAFDVQAVCSGFLYALTTADALLKTQQCKTILVIGAEKMSAILDWTDRNTCILFGDGAGAVLLRASEDSSRGILATELHSDGTLYDALHTDGGVGLNGEAGVIHMNGREIFRHATEKMTDSIRSLLANNQLKNNDIHHLIPHQANKRILDYIAKKLLLDASQVVSTVQHHGNTSAASIPLAMDSANQAQRFQPQDLLMLTALGAGLTWGSAAIRW